MSRADIPEWIRLACNRWGRQKRRIWSGKDWHGNIDGYAESLLGRIRDERDGTGQGPRTQKWAEVFWGDGLDVQRSLVGMPEPMVNAMHVHYVFDPEWGLTAQKKAAVLGISHRTYWETLKNSEFWVFSRLDRAHDQVREFTMEVSAKHLPQPAKTAINTVHLIASPKLSFEALQRAKLARR